jgi:hypothetical protein
MIFVDPLLNTKVSVRARGLRYQQYTDWDVLLYGIPFSDKGKEVIVTWYTPDIDNKDVFFTDSNGLEMQHRVLNKRPSYKFSSD